MPQTLKGLVGGGMVLAFVGVAAASGDLRLVDAVKRQDVPAVQALLRQRADVNAPEPDGSTALHWAAHHDDADTAGLLITAGARVNAQNALGVTPLYLACTNGSTAMVERLLAANANPNTALPTGEAPLMMCARTGNVTAVRALLARGAEVNARERSREQTALMWAVQARHPEVVQALVERGAAVDARTSVEKEFVYTGYRYITAAPKDLSQVTSILEQGGFTPLLFAAQQGDVESARILLAAGARVNDAAPVGTTPLVVAVHSGNGAVAAFLLSKGADPNIATAGYSALHAAVLRGDRDLVAALLAHGADPNSRLVKGTPVRKYSKDYALSVAWVGATPFWLASRFAEVAIMRTLVAAGANPTLTIEDGTTPLHAAILAKQGLGDRRERYISPVEVAAIDPAEDERQTVDTVAAAIDLGADINATTPSGDTPLHSAVSKRYLTVVELLGKRGAALSVKNAAGKTPLALIPEPLRRADDRSSPADGPTAADALLRRIADSLRTLGAHE